MTNALPPPRRFVPTTKPIGVPICPPSVGYVPTGGDGPVTYSVVQRGAEFVWCVGRGHVLLQHGKASTLLLAAQRAGDAAREAAPAGEEPVFTQDFAAPEMLRQIDPMHALMVSLQSRGAPSMEWAVRWGTGGVDALQAAWAASHDGEAMFAVAAMATRPLGALGVRLMRAATEQDIVVQLSGGRMGCGSLYGIDAQVRFADALRPLAPLLPPLPDLVARTKALMSSDPLAWPHAESDAHDAVPELEDADDALDAAMHAAVRARIALGDSVPDALMKTMIVAGGGARVRELMRPHAREIVEATNLDLTQVARCAACGKRFPRLNGSLPPMWHHAKGGRAACSAACLKRLGGAIPRAIPVARKAPKKAARKPTRSRRR